MDHAETEALRRTCTRFVRGHGQATAGTALSDISPETELDHYGAGGVVTALESRIAELFGKPAAAYFPSGTMAQQVALRVHAEHRHRRSVAFHPSCHLWTHENGAFERLQGLIGRPVGGSDRLLTLDDLQTIAEPLAALLIELPQRAIGGQQPPFEELCSQLAWAREQGAATHLDGARIWESAAGYQLPIREIAEPFDTVYASFYKGIGALPGCCVTGSDGVIAEIREWRHRMGGTVLAMWPGAASALACLERRLPMMPSYMEAGRVLADALRVIPGIRLVPDPPQTPMMHLLLDVNATDFIANAHTLAEDGIWTWPEPIATIHPGVQRVELAIGDATLAWQPDELANVIARLLRP